MRPQITILTDPVRSGPYSFIEPARSLARNIRHRFNPRPAFRRSRYRGHFAVTRSMVEGLQKIGIPFSYNPSKLAEVGEVVVAPGGFAALHQAIQWKRKGFIRRLLAGTNLVDFPSECRKLMCAEEIDLLLVPADWVRDNFIADCPELRGRVISWPAGVDTAYWHPGAGKSQKRCLIYEKQLAGRERVGPVSDYVRIIEERGYQTSLIQYGTYMPDYYLRALRRSCALIGFVLNETQGIAWAEAWSANVPTLLWNQAFVNYKRRTYPASTAPYLTSRTGLFFTSLTEFEAVFEQWSKNRDLFHPRQWVIENMSDEVCARRLCTLADIPCE